MREKKLGIAAAALALFCLGAEFPDYVSPTCEALTEKWNRQFSKDLKLADPTLKLDPLCESKQANLAYGLDILERYLPDLYARFISAKQIALGGPSPDSTLADTEAETQLITIYDSLLKESREYVAAQLAHEAAHLRADDINHVPCDHGDLKGEEAACAADFTGALKGDAYNFSYVALKKLYALSTTNADLNREEIQDLITDLLKNNFNKVPAEVLSEWHADEN